MDCSAPPGFRYHAAMWTTSRPPWPLLPIRFFLLVLVGVVGLEASAPYWADDPPNALFLRILQIAWMLLCVVRIDLWAALGMNRPVAADIRLFTYVAAACSAVSLTLLALPLGLLEQVAAPPIVVSWPGVLLFLLAGPVAEELFFRGYIYGFLRQTFGISLSVAASALVFALMHGSWAVPQMAGGIVFALAYEYSRNLWVPVGLHIGANSAVLLAAWFAGALPWSG